jgi:hypothetical protein
MVLGAFECPTASASSIGHVSWPAFMGEGDDRRVPECYSFFASEKVWD